MWKFSLQQRFFFRFCFKYRLQVCDHTHGYVIYYTNKIQEAGNWCLPEHAGNLAHWLAQVANFTPGWTALDNYIQDTVSIRILDINLFHVNKTFLDDPLSFCEDVQARTACFLAYIWIFTFTMETEKSYSPWPCLLLFKITRKNDWQTGQSATHLRLRSIIITMQKSLFKNVMLSTTVSPLFIIGKSHLRKIICWDQIVPRRLTFYVFI